jgi:hypothetical protein
MQTDTTHSFTLNFDGEDSCRIILIGIFNKSLAILPGIRMRKLVGHEFGDVDIIGVFDQTFQIMKLPGTKDELHGNMVEFSNVIKRIVSHDFMYI